MHQRSRRKELDGDLCNHGPPPAVLASEAVVVDRLQAVGIGLFVPLALQTLRLLGGEGLLPWSDITDDAIFTGLFGGIAGGLTLTLAQIADRVLPPGVHSKEDLLLRNADAAIAAAELERARAGGCAMSQPLVLHDKALQDHSLIAR